MFSYNDEKISERTNEKKDMVFRNIQLIKINKEPKQKCDNCGFRFENDLMGIYLDNKKSVKEQTTEQENANHNANCNEGPIEYHLCCMCEKFFQIQKYPLNMYSVSSLKRYIKEDIYELLIYKLMKRYLKFGKKDILHSILSKQDYDYDFDYIFESKNYKDLFSYLKKEIQNNSLVETKYIISDYNLNYRNKYINTNSKEDIDNVFFSNFENKEIKTIINIFDNDDDDDFYNQKNIYFFCFPLEFDLINNKPFMISIIRNFMEPNYNPSKYLSNNSYNKKEFLKIKSTLLKSKNTKEKK